MNSLNSVSVEGNLTDDPELNTLESGAKSASFKIESTRFFNQEGERKSEASFFEIEVWNKTAELVVKTLKKGKGVRVVGRLKQDRWTDKDDVKHSKVKIVGEVVEFKTAFDKKA